MNALLGLAILVPLALALLGLARPIRPAIPWLAGPATLPALALALLGTPGVSLELPWLFMGTRLGLDPVGQVFLFVTALLWGIAGVFAVPYLGDDARSFFVAWLLAFAGNVGLVLAEDVLSFYLFFALMSFASYPLVVHEGHREARWAGAVYLALIIVGEMALFAGVALATAGAENSAFSDLRVTDATTAWLLLVGLGVKAGLVPLHVWLPLAHPVAPTPASAVLSGAMIKAGLLGWLRFLPLGEAALPAHGTGLVVLGLLAAFGAVLVGLAQRQAKAVLAYSSVSQMGLMATIVGLGLLDPEDWQPVVVAVFALHHGLAKGALFLGVGVAQRAWSGAGRVFVILGLVFPALAIAGAPWTSGAVAKAALKLAVKEAPGAWVDQLLLLVSLSSLATTVLMGRFLRASWPGDGGARGSVGLAVPWAVLLGVVASVLWLLPWEPLRETVAESTHLVPGREDLWPLGLGLLVVGAGLAAERRGRSLPVRVPPGDLLVPVVAVAVPLVRVVADGSRATGAAWSRATTTFGALAVSAVRGTDEVAGRVEDGLRRWGTLGALVLLLALSVAILATA